MKDIYLQNTTKLNIMKKKKIIRKSTSQLEKHPFEVQPFSITSESDLIQYKKKLAASILEGMN